MLTGRKRCYFVRATTPQRPRIYLPSLSRGFEGAFPIVTVLKEASPSAASCCPFLIILEHPSGVGHRCVSCFGSGLPDTCSATTSSYEKLLSWLLQTEVSTQHAVFYFSSKVLFIGQGYHRNSMLAMGQKLSESHEIQINILIKLDKKREPMATQET